MFVLQYMFAADMFPVFCLNMTLQGKGCKYKTSLWIGRQQCCLLRPVSNINCFSLHTKHIRSSHFRLFLRQSGLEPRFGGESVNQSPSQRGFLTKEVFIVQPFLRAAVFTLVDGDTLGRPFSQFHVHVGQRDARWQPGGRTKLLLPADGRETHCNCHLAQCLLARRPVVSVCSEISIPSTAIVSGWGQMSVGR